MKDKSEIGENWGIAMTLLEQPLTVEGIMEQFRAFSRRFGFFGDILSDSIHRGVDFRRWLLDHLEELIAIGWVTESDQTYTLTQAGRAAADKARAEIEQTRDRIKTLATAQNASKLTLIVHLFLAALKLPAGILSGSVGLLNDAIDTLLDGISSLLVYWGIRVNRERLVSRVLVLFMLATGCFALVESVLRIIRREPVEADWFAFVAVLVSAAVCGVLWFVQRFIGLHRKSLALITQSVDSRNHVIVAIGVTAGLIAAVLRFSWLDYLVGLSVAILILKSAIELAVELIRSRNEETPNLSKFQFGVYERFRQVQLRSYMLYLVREGQARTKQQLLSTAEDSFDFKDNVLLQSVGADRIEDSRELIQSCYDGLIRKKLLSEGSQLELTAAGEKGLASNRFFLKDEQSAGLKISTGGAVRIAFSLLVRWVLFFALYGLAAATVLPRLPPLPLWNSIDVALFSVGPVHLTLFNLLHLAVGFLLVTHAAVRMSLIFQRHLSLRERRGRKYTKLQTGGFYGRVRHPMAATHLLFHLGICFAFCTIWAVVPFALLALLAFLSGIIEERRELAKRFATEYQAYKRTVPRRYLTPWLAIYLGSAAAAFAAGAVL